MVSVPEQAEQLLSLLEAARHGAMGVVFRADCRLRGADRDRRPLPGAARAVSVAGGSIRPVRTAWRAPGFLDRRTADQRRLAETERRRELRGRHDRRARAVDRRPRPADGTDCPSRWSIDVATARTRRRRTGRGARGAAAGRRHPGDGRGAGRGHRATGLSGRRQAASDGRGVHRTRQRHRPA